jgi:hypothetical protein
LHGVTNGHRLFGPSGISELLSPDPAAETLYDQRRVLTYRDEFSVTWSERPWVALKSGSEFSLVFEVDDSGDRSRIVLPVTRIDQTDRSQLVVRVLRDAAGHGLRVHF